MISFQTIKWKNFLSTGNQFTEIDFTKKFKLANYLVPLSIALFANSSIVEKKDSKYLSYRSKVWQDTSRGGLPELFLENVDFEKYADFVINYPILFLKKDNRYLSGDNYKFSDYMSGNIKKINKLYNEGHQINYWTARGTVTKKDFYELTYNQLISWDCKFHSLSVGKKPAYDLLICDKTKRIEEI